MWLLIVRRAGKTELIFSEHDQQEGAISEREHMLRIQKRSKQKYPILWTAIVHKKDRTEDIEEAA